jgi:hypothetical protein
MSAARGIKAGAAYVELYTKNSPLIKGLRDAEKKLKAFGAGITAIGTRISGLGAAIAGPMLASTSVFASMGDTLAKMSGRTGVSVEALSELGYAADQSGANLESLEAAVRRMQKQVVEAAKQSEDALAAARREWEEALAEAAAKRMDAQAGQGPESIKRAELELEGLDDVIDSTRQKVDVVGTFNPLAAVSLSSDSLGERTAKASEQVAANTKRLVQEAQLGGLVFS